MPRLTDRLIDRWLADAAKVCPVCTKNFHRSKRHSFKQWRSQTFCSYECWIGSQKRAKMLEAMRGHPPSAATRAKISLSWQKRQVSVATRKKMSTVHRGKLQSPTTREKISAASVKRAQSAEGRAHLVAMSRAARLAHPTSIELIVRQVLEQMQILYIAEYRIGPYSADIFVPEKHLVIECDGNYWHSRHAERDARRDAYMAKWGYNVLRLPEQEIQNGQAGARVLRAISGVSA